MGTIITKPGQKPIRPEIIEREKARGFVQRGVFLKKLRCITDGLVFGAEAEVPRFLGKLQRKRDKWALRRKEAVKVLFVHASVGGKSIALARKALDWRIPDVVPTKVLDHLDAAIALMAAPKVNVAAAQRALIWLSQASISENSSQNALYNNRLNESADVRTFSPSTIVDRFRQRRTESLRRHGTFVLVFEEHAYDARRLERQLAHQRAVEGRAQ